MRINFYKWPMARKKKIGLVLSGGGARGFGHIGVLKAFMEHGIEFNLVTATSVGSVVGALYCAGMSYEEMHSISKRFTLKDLKTSKIPLMPNKPEALENILNELLNGKNFEDLKIPMVAVATDVRTGEEVHLHKGNVAKSVSASCAVPGFFSPVYIDDKVLFDGGLLNNVPTSVAKKFGCDAIVAVDINSTRGGGTNSDKYLDMVMASISIMMKNSSIRGYKDADIIIKPNLKNFKSTKIISPDEMIEQGYIAALEKMDEIKTLFGIKVKKPKHKKEKRVNRKNKTLI